MYIKKLFKNKKVNTTESLAKLKTQVETIAENYAQLVDEQLKSALAEGEIDSMKMARIDDGIRMLNHAAAVLERINRIQRGDTASGLYN